MRREDIRLPIQGAAARCYFGRQTVAIDLPAKSDVCFILFAGQLPWLINITLFLSGNLFYAISWHAACYA
ncbi:hypothetical protein FG183_11525 [Serratia marcescens subsp. marcescens ATCC 13880]|nr:hypothetical protein FG183_11525 [Serratia marcescens subsp. marcescens ATCC 13880]